MVDWSFPPELQAQYDRVLADVRRLQAEFGITPMTLEERALAYEQRRKQEQQRQIELAKLQAITANRRPIPKWKP